LGGFLPEDIDLERVVVSLDPFSLFSEGFFEEGERALYSGGREFPRENLGLRRFFEKIASEIAHKSAAPNIKHVAKQLLTLRRNARENARER
jgi:hypothetical protein